MLDRSYHARNALPAASDLGQRITAVLPTVFEQFGTNDGTNRTKMAMTLFGELGHSLGFRVSCKRSCYPQANDPEWLYDQLWYVTRADNSMIRVPMVLEAEFTDTEPHIDGDFQKLLLARADVRVWLWQTVDALRHIDLYKQQIRDFDHSLPGDEWVFGGYDWRKQAPVIERFTVESRSRTL